MSKKATVLWCIYIGILDALYCVFCLQIPHVQNYMWIGFISLPIFFCGGATLPLFPRYFLSAASGVFWGALTFAILGLGLIASYPVNLLVVVALVVSICCIAHLAVFTEDVLGGLFSNCPMVFGGFAAIFSQGLSEAPGVMAALTLGLLLGVMITYGGQVIARIVDKAPVPQPAL